MNEALRDIRNLAFVYNHVLEEEIPPEWLELLTKLDEEEARGASTSTDQALPRETSSTGRWTL